MQGFQFRIQQALDGKPAAGPLPADLLGDVEKLRQERRENKDHSGQTFDYAILKKQMTIGRAHGTDIRVASHFVSRVHATIRTKGTATIIEDAGSKNGLVVNAERVSRHPPRDGDVNGVPSALSGEHHAFTRALVNERCS